MRRYLPELVALPMLPLLIAQGKCTRRITPRLPEAGGAAEGIAGAGDPGQPLSLLTIGESPVDRAQSECDYLLQRMILGINGGRIW